MFYFDNLATDTLQNKTAAEQSRLKPQNSSYSADYFIFIKERSKKIAFLDFSVWSPLSVCQLTPWRLTWRTSQLAPIALAPRLTSCCLKNSHWPQTLHETTTYLPSCCQLELTGSCRPTAGGKQPEKERRCFSCFAPSSCTSPCWCVNNWRGVV